MYKLSILCSVLCCAFVMVNCVGDVGPGMWNVKYVTKCEEAYHTFKFDVVQKKINRTHDGFCADLILNEDFTDVFGVRIDICKDVDGGCKPYQVLSDDSFFNFVNKYAKENVISCLTIAGVDPPEFPIKKGEYHVVDYMFDYDELPKESAHGEFKAKAYILEGSLEVGCVEVTVEFKECDEDDD